MSLSSASTLTDVLAQYNNNLSWDGDSTKAAAALEAIRWLLVNRPIAATKAGISLNYEVLEKEKSRLEAFIGASASSDTRKRCSFVRARAIND
jgi:hypothetical protein